MKIAVQAWRLGKVCGILCLLTSCSLLISPKRTLTNQVRRYQNFINDADYAKAAKYCHPTKFAWYQNGKKYKGNAITAFHKSIERIPSKQAFVIEINRIVELSKNKYEVTGRMLAKQSDSASIRSVQWKCSMIWVLHNSRWYLMEVKETSPRKRYSS